MHRRFLRSDCLSRRASMRVQRQDLEGSLDRDPARGRVGLTTKNTVRPDDVMQSRRARMNVLIESGREICVPSQMLLQARSNQVC